MHEDLLSYSRSQLCSQTTGASGAPMVVEQMVQSTGPAHQAVVAWPEVTVNMRYHVFVEQGTEVMAWVYEQFGRDDSVWQYTVHQGTVTFFFNTVTNALLFKLTWGS